jgi:hypothetical protein
MLPLAHIGLSSSGRAGFRAVIVVLAWLALWLSVLVATLDRAQPRPQREARISTASPLRA